MILSIKPKKRKLKPKINTQFIKSLRNDIKEKTLVKKEVVEIKIPTTLHQAHQLRFSPLFFSILLICASFTS